VRSFLRFSPVWGWLFILTLPIYAGEVVTWEQCILEAADNNPDIKSVQELWKSKVYQESALRSNNLPQISVNLSANDSSFKTTFTREYDANVTLTQNLFSGFNDASKIKQARANAEEALANLNIAKANLSFSLKSAFQELVYSVENEKLTQNISLRREENSSLVELQFEGGLENKGSVLLSKADAEQARFENLQAHNAIRLRTVQLAQVMGRDPRSEFTVTGLIPTKEPTESTPDFTQLVASTPDLKQALAKEAFAESAIDIARSGYYPSLNFVGVAGRRGEDFFPSDKTWSLELRLSYPLFSGLRDYHSLKSASAQWMSSTQSRINIDSTLMSSLREAYYNYIESVKKLTVDESYLEAVRVRAEIARSRYNSGLLSFEEWYVIENDFISRQKNYLQSKKNRIINEAAWEKAQGKGVFYE
jgi:outer membrane protein TolC